MSDPNIFGQVDIAFLCVLAFVTFFVGLVYYLRKEDKREGYPMEYASTRGGMKRTEGFPAMPAPKTFYRPQGLPPVLAPNPETPKGFEDQLDRLGRGLPLIPGPDPLLEGIGAAARATNRENKPDLDIEGAPKIAPLSQWPAYYVAAGDPDPRGWPMMSGDDVRVGTVTDLWFNKAEFFLRYFAFESSEDGMVRLAPAFFAEADPHHRIVKAMTLTATDMARAPLTASLDQVTMREEDEINAFYSGGMRYSQGGHGA